METIEDILREMRTYVELGCRYTPWGDAIEEFADRIEAAYERELIVVTSKAAAEGYAAGKDDRHEG